MKKFVMALLISAVAVPAVAEDDQCQKVGEAAYNASILRQFLGSPSGRGGTPNQVELAAQAAPEFAEYIVEEVSLAPRFESSHYREAMSRFLRDYFELFCRDGSNPEAFETGFQSIKATFLRETKDVEILDPLKASEDHFEAEIDRIDAEVEAYRRDREF